MEAAHYIETFTHVRILIAMIVSLSVARVLSGIARLIQHPKRNKLSVLHLLWVFSMLFELILFWWWSVQLATRVEWTFATFIVHISYVVMLFLMSALLFPDDIAEYKGYQDFFIQRRYWFFACLSTTWIIDLGKAVVAGSNISSHLMLHAATTFILCALAVCFKTPKLQIAIVLIYLARQLYSI